MAARRAVIENPKTGEQYAVTPADFRKHYEGNGFRILHWEGGEEYADKGKAASTDDAKARRAARARERRAARKQSAAATEPEPASEEE